MYKTSRELKVTIPAQDLVSTLLDDMIAEQVSDMVTEEHDGNGIVIPGSVKIISRTPLYQDLTRFDGAYACHVRYVANCYDAPKGMTTTTTVRVTLPNGILCETETPELSNPAFRVFLPFDVHPDGTRNTMRTLIKDQIVRFRSIQRYGGLGDTTIDVIGEFLEVVGGPSTPSKPDAQARSAHLQGKNDLHVDDFKAPTGPDSDDPAVHKEHYADNGEPTTKDALPTPEDDTPPVTDEPDLYNLWVSHNASLVKKQASTAGRHLVRSIQTLGNTQQMWYDPTTRRFTAFLKGLDVPAKHAHYLFRPLPTDNLGSVRGIIPQEPVGYTPVAEYAITITNPTTRKHPSAIRVLQESLPRRLYGVLPERVTVFSFLDNPRIAFEPVNVANVDTLPVTSTYRSHTVHTTVHKLDYENPIGEQITTFLKELQEGTSESSPDLMILDARHAPELMEGGDEEHKSPEEEPQVVLDPFVPTYPVVIDTNVLVCTPSQATQCMPHYTSTKSPMETLKGVLTGSAIELGGHIQRPPGSSGSVPITIPTLGPSPTLRATPVNPEMVRSMPTIEHGWMSLDTRSALAGTIRTLQPRTIFELGSWYGLSTRTMLDEAKHTTIYAFDKFKAPPILSYNKKRTGVEDNFFFHHPRQDTFAANVSTSLTGLGEPIVGSASAAAAAAASSASASSSERNAVVMVKGDASKSIQFATENKIAPQMVFIDFEKNTKRLKAFIKTIQRSFPKAVIVGDDHIFESVKRAVRSFPKESSIVLDESYILLPADFPKDLRTSLQESITSVREEYKDTPATTIVREHIKAGRISDVLRAYPDGESVSTVLPHTEGQMALHEAIRMAKTSHPRAFTSEVIQELIDESAKWENGSLNFATLTPWDYIAHKISFFNGRDTS